MGKGEPARLGFLILLKTFQQLGYFIALRDVPRSIIEHIGHHHGLLIMVDLEHGGPNQVLQLLRPALPWLRGPGGSISELSPESLSVVWTVERRQPYPKERSSACVREQRAAKKGLHEQARDHQLR